MLKGIFLFPIPPCYLGSIKLACTQCCKGLESYAASRRAVDVETWFERDVYGRLARVDSSVVKPHATDDAAQRHLSSSVCHISGNCNGFHLFLHLKWRFNTYCT
ncbi:hypothetical protein RRG08_033544 [Elysia crispata]|uniref:Uncharacterized protein n=1 Tax=Elysia crispata TaxID=231223 RepID=A0AAE1CJQ6_9GAST|nr:hypothetical protein RRG08_033544 [Elysia crispata]